MKKTAAYVVIAGLAFAAAARARPRRAAPNPLERDLGPKPELQPEPEHVGQQGFTWPLADRFEAPSDFQRALQHLGYDLPKDGDVLGKETQAAVESFKLDWNAVARHSEIGENLGRGGFIDLPTVPAIAGALHMQKSRVMNWSDIVAESLELSKPEVG